MRKYLNSGCARLLVIVMQFALLSAFLSACGSGGGEQPQTGSGAGSTASQQTEADPGTGMTYAQQTETDAASTVDETERASAAGTAAAGTAAAGTAAAASTTSAAAGTDAAASAAGDQLPPVPRQSLEDVFRNHDSFTDDLSKWNAKAESRSRSGWYSNLTSEEEEAVIDSMNADFRRAVLELAYERLEDPDDYDDRGRCLKVLLQHDMISKDAADRYLLASSLYADNLAEELWKEIDQIIEKARKEDPDLFPEPEPDYLYEDEMGLAAAGGGMVEESAMETGLALASESSASDDAETGSPESAQNKRVESGQPDTPDGQMPDPDEAPDFNTAEYNTIRENPFKSVASSPLSTFSIDVDTAGYTKLKYDILDGYQIEKDEVKIEELINYFNYDYSGDRVGEEPFTVSTEYTRCPWNPGHGLVRIGIRADDRQEKPATNFVLVTDVSGSMMLINKLPLALSAYADMLEGFDEKDTVSLMYYASGQGVVLENVSCDKKDEIYRGLAELLFNAGGGTYGSLGLQTAYEMAEKSYVENGVNRVLLATDGDFNIGATSEGALKEIVEAGRQKGVYLTILGYGAENLKDNKMEVMAENGNGNYHYIGDMADAEKALVQESASTLIPMADDVKIQVEFNPALVQEYRLIGYESRILNAEDFNNDKVDAGDVGAGKTVTALYELVPAGGESETSVPDLKYSSKESAGEDSELCNVAIRYKEINSGKTGSESRLVERPVLAADYHEIPDDNTALAISLAEAGMVIRGSEFKGTATLTSAEAIAEVVAADSGSDLVKSWAELLGTLIRQSE